MPLKLWQKCSRLAATRHFCKASAAVTAAWTVLQCMHTAGIISVGHNPAAAHTSSTNSISAALQQQLQQSGLLEHLPTLLTDAAHQLRAVSGVWPANIDAAEKARFESVMQSPQLRDWFAERQAFITQRLMAIVCRTSWALKRQ
jgi:hypothetical protein